MKKIYSIALIIAFFAVIVQPIIPFVQYYYVIQQNQIDIQQDTCSCSCKQAETAKMASNGDTYLKALLKRVCNDKKKETPQIPIVNIPVFVKILYVHRQQIFELSQKNYNKISDFIIQPSTSSYIKELLQPPQLS